MANYVFSNYMIEGKKAELDEFDEVISEKKYHWYSNGSQASSRLAALAA